MLSFPLPPAVRFPVPPALQRCSPACQRAALSPGALRVGLRSPRSWHPAEGKRAERERPCPRVPPALLTPEQHIQQTAQARSLGTVLGSRQARSHCPAPFSPLHLRASCHFPGPVTPYSLLHWCPDWYIVFESFSYFPTLLTRPDTISIFLVCFLFPVSVFLLFWKTSSSFSQSTLEHKHLGLES